MKTLFQKMVTLWKEFLPLSVSDITMAFSDPMVNATLAQMPRMQTNLAALGIAKSLVVLFESPIIMMLHASSTLSSNKEARMALWRFVLIACTLLTLILGVLAIPVIFFPFIQNIMGIPYDIAVNVHKILLCVLFWPASIAIRRYFQGILIIHGQLRIIARAGFLRIFVLFLCLISGYSLGLPSTYLAGGALMLAISSETLAIYLYAKKYKNITPEIQNKPTAEHNPRTVKEIWRFYWPLAHSMVLVWGGRALLIVILAKSADNISALAIWPATWALVLLFANATRMVQQVIIRNKDSFHPLEFIIFAFSIGLCFSALLVFLSLSSFGSKLLILFVGTQAVFLESVRSVLLICLFVPILVSIQNVLQGFLMCNGKTHSINRATLCSTSVLLVCAYYGVTRGFLGATVAAYSMLIALTVESLILSSQIHWKLNIHKYLQQQNIQKGVLS